MSPRKSDGPPGGSLAGDVFSVLHSERSPLSPESRPGVTWWPPRGQQGYRHGGRASHRPCLGAPRAPRRAVGPCALESTGLGRDSGRSAHSPLGSCRRRDGAGGCSDHSRLPCDPRQCQWHPAYLTSGLLHRRQRGAGQPSPRACIQTPASPPSHTVSRGPVI